MPKNSTDNPDVRDDAAVAEEATPPPGDAGASTDLDAAALQKERDSLYDRLLRTTAEFDNYRKRVDRERRDLAEYTAADIVSEMLPIVDNLERALAAASESDPLRKGVELILKQMLDMLRKRGVKPIEALGTDFDPNFHQAVIHEVSGEHREGEVMEELQRGYLLGDRLLRPSMVKVAKPA